MSTRSYVSGLPRSTNIRRSANQAPSLQPYPKYDPPEPCTPEDHLVPPALHPPKDELISSLPDFNRNSCEFVVFDLETTGLRSDCEICQIAAMSVSDRTVWSTYVLPSCAIDPDASLVTGLVVRYAGNDRYLTHHGKHVRALPCKESILALYNHFRELSRIARHILCIGYCSKSFDVPILCNNFSKFGIPGDKLDSLGVCFVDAFPLVKYLTKTVNSACGNAAPLERATLSHVYEHLFDKRFPAHNAVTDVKALSQILFHSPLKVSPNSLIAQATTAGSAFANMEFQKKKASLLSTMHGLLFLDPPARGPISKYMAGKIAASGLGYDDLERIYKVRGREGLAQVCQAPVYTDNGKTVPRVTSNADIIQAIVKYFEELEET